MKIKTKLFLVNAALVVLLLSSITYLLVSRNNDIVLKHVKANAAATLSQITQNLDLRLASYEKITNSLYLNTRIQSALLRSHSDYKVAYQAYFEDLKPYVSVVQTMNDVNKIVFYTENPTFQFSNVILLNPELRESAWFKQLMRSPSSSLWTTSGRTGQFESEVFSLKQRMNYVDPDSELLVSVQVKKQIVYGMVSQVSEGNRIIISLAGGDVLLDTQSADESGHIKDYPFYSMLSGQGGSGDFQFELDNESYILFHRTIESRSVVRGMKVIMLVSVEELLSDIRSIRDLAVVLLGISCAVSALLIYLITVGMMRRLTELSIRMGQVQRDNFRAQIRVRGRDEISQLGNIFNHMVRHLDQLIHKVYMGEINRNELQLRIKEAELYALQNQINPHFLNNVLNSIRGNLLERGDVHNAEVISLLAKSFRSMLKSKGPVISLKEECEIVSVYLRIQQYRFTDRLSFTIRVPEELETIQIPSMSLQPVVENVIVHVMEQWEEHTQIDISAERKADSVLVTVKDNGSGIPDDRLKQINESLSAAKFEQREAHFGLWNVHQRLQKTFGMDSGIHVENTSAGTCVTLKVFVGKGEGFDV
jgi:two-component system sensor histidine kinase YesM